MRARKLVEWIQLLTLFECVRHRLPLGEKKKKKLKVVTLKRLLIKFAVVFIVK